MSQAPEPKSTAPHPLLPVDEALERLLAALQPLPHEVIPLGEARARVLALDVAADLDQPAFERAMMDGFAVRAADCESEGAELVAIGAAPAGQAFDGAVGPGQCVRVMTGGVVPAGADSVVAVERTELLHGSVAELEGSRWRIDQAVRNGQNVAMPGAEVAAGEVVLHAGDVLDGARIGTAAAFGQTHLTVHRRPVVAILPTGSEVVPIDQRPELGQVRDSNRHAIAALAERCGATLLSLPVALDERDALAESLADAVRQADIVVTSGGVSMGDFDLVAGAVSDLQAEVLFHKIQLKPGKPLLCARLGGRLLMGLPGNPVSSYVCALLFLRPAIAALQGASCQRWLRAKLPLAAELPATRGRLEVRPARFEAGAGQLQVAPVQMTGSADLAHFSGRDVLLARPPHLPAAAPGDDVEVLLWPEPA